MSSHIDRLLLIGQMLSNVAYNWKQRRGYVLTQKDCEDLADMQRSWDAAKNAYREENDELLDDTTGKRK